MKQKERTMTDREKAEARFEMDGVTLNGDWSEAQKALKECAQRHMKKTNRQTS